MPDDPCNDLEKALAAAQGALVLAVESAQELPRTVDEDELSEKDAAISAAVDEAQDWVEQIEIALRECREDKE